MNTSTTTLKFIGTHYAVVDSQSGAHVGKPRASLRAAHRRADRLDSEYGAVRYLVARIAVLS